MNAVWGRGAMRGGGRLVGCREGLYNRIGRFRRGVRFCGHII